MEVERVQALTQQVAGASVDVGSDGSGPAAVGRSASGRSRNDALPPLPPGHPSGADLPPPPPRASSGDVHGEAPPNLGRRASVEDASGYMTPAGKGKMPPVCLSSSHEFASMCSPDAAPQTHHRGRGSSAATADIGHSPAPAPRTKAALGNTPASFRPGFRPAQAPLKTACTFFFLLPLWCARLLFAILTRVTTHRVPPVAQTAPWNTSVGRDICDDHHGRARAICRGWRV